MPIDVDDDDLFCLWRLPYISYWSNDLFLKIPCILTPKFLMHLGSGPSFSKKEAPEKKLTQGNRLVCLILNPPLYVMTLKAFKQLRTRIRLNY